MTNTACHDQRSVQVKGKQIASRRRDLFMTQRGLAEAAGLTVRTVARLEAAEAANVYLNTAPRLAAALKLAIEDFTRDYINQAEAVQS